MALRNILEISSCTDPGIVRSFNEDSISASTDIGLLVLADGMGGYKAGDVASSLATSIVTSEVKKAVQEQRGVQISKSVREAISKANRTIYRTAQGDPRYQGMGTTVVMLLLDEDKAVIAHVGDSRLYRLRHGGLELLTHDHSILQEQVELGLITTEDAKVSHNRNLVTRALGVSEEVELDLIEVPAVVDDIFLLCSDGLNDMVDDADIELVLNSLQSNLPLAAQQLVMIANDNGGHDNVSVIIGRVVAKSDEPEGLFGKMFGWFK